METTMSSLIQFAALQTTGPQTPSNDPPAALYFIIAIIALVLGLVVTIFIRTSARRSSRR
jgi:hypothetical protein